MLKSAVIEEKKFKHSPWAGADNTLGPKILRLTGRPHHYDHLLQVQKESLQPLILYTSFHDLINVYNRRSGADNPRGQILMSTETSCHFGHLLQVLKKSF